MFNPIRKKYLLEVKSSWKDIAQVTRETKEAIKESRLETFRRSVDDIKNFELEDRLLDYFLVPYEGETFDEFKYRYDNLQLKNADVNHIQYLLKHRDLVFNKFLLANKADMSEKLDVRMWVKKNYYSSIVYAKKNFMFRGEKVAENLSQSMDQAQVPYEYTSNDGLLW